MTEGKVSGRRCKLKSKGRLAVGGERSESESEK